jgi:hypothetical protein
MTAATQPYLIDFFTNHLPFTPTPSQIALFESDLSIVSPYTMRDALKEVARGTTFKYRPLEDWRVGIFEIYNRKVAENAKLYPVFHTFETAFRSTVAVRIEEYYGVPDWWSPAVLAHRSGSQSMTINGVSLPHWVAPELLENRGAPRPA